MTFDTGWWVQKGALYTLLFWSISGIFHNKNFKKYTSTQILNNPISTIIYIRTENYYINWTGYSAHEKTIQAPGKQACPVGIGALLSAEGRHATSSHKRAQRSDEAFLMSAIHGFLPTDRSLTVHTLPTLSPNSRLLGTPLAKPRALSRPN